MDNRERPSGTKHRSRTLAAAGLGTVALLAACGSSLTGCTTHATAAPPASASGLATSSSAISCAQITSLRTSLSKLSHAAASLGSAGQLSTELRDVERQSGALNGQVRKAFSAQISQLSSDLELITKDAGTLVLHPSASNVTAFTGAVHRLKITSEPMIREIKQIKAACP
ncbi:MAG: hypothetical protein ACLQFR_16330 [Streptosporangiaceae bacterium]